MTLFLTGENSTSLTESSGTLAIVLRKAQSYTTIAVLSATIASNPPSGEKETAEMQHLSRTCTVSNTTAF
jgi:hypothetical protein